MAGTITAYYPLNYADQTILPGAGQACLDAYNANVSCPQAIGSLYADLYPSFNTTVLDTLCSAACFDSLIAHRRNVSEACGSSQTYYSQSDGSTWPATYKVDDAIYNYNLTCLTRSDDGEYCNTWFQTAENVTVVPECDECYLQTVYMQVQSPLDQDPAEILSIYASMSSSCSYTGPAASQTVTGLAIASPTATLACTSQYTVQASDTYLSVSESQNVATHDLVTANGLNYNLTDLPTAGSLLCIRNQCTVYVVQANDTCDSIATAGAISLAQLHAWNAQINGLCNNLNDTVSQTICLSNPLGDYTVSNTSGAATATYITTIAPQPTDLAFGTNTDCGEYYEVAAGEDCGTVELKFAITLDDFLFLNPEVYANCTNLWADTSYCVAAVGAISTYPGYATTTASWTITPATSTPIAWYDPFAVSNDTANTLTVIPLANDTRTDCWDYLWWNASLSSPPTCWELAGSFDLSGEQLVLWNPSLEDTTNATTTAYDYDCTIAPSVSYCVAVASPTTVATATTSTPTTAPPSPRGAGEIDTCTAWFVGVLSCASHLSLLQIDIATLYAYNPSVGPECTGFVLGTYYCYSTEPDGSVPVVSGTGTTVSPTTTSSSSATSSSGSGVVTPTPTQAGMVANCDAFYDVQNNDGCYDIAADHGISLADFYAWNPAVGGDCSTLYPGYYVCVGIASSSTTTTSSSIASTTYTSTTTSSASQPTSTDGTCGSSISSGTCLGSTFGDCCSSSGFCGSTTAYCGSGCQASYGSCDGSATISPDGTCAGANAYSCAGSSFGDCCSSSDFCGSTADYCGSGCQSGFGSCT